MTRLVGMVLAGMLAVWGYSAHGEEPVVEGNDGWLFLGSEIRHLEAGPFWGEAAMTASRAAREDARDPTPAIVAFHEALAAKGITLLLVPVPPKALMLSDKLPEDRRNLAWGDALDTYYDLLREQGVAVLDLREAFAEAAKRQDKPLYCREDSHWSGYGCVMAAEAVAESIGDLLEPGDLETTAVWEDLELTGDLRVMLGGDGKETVAIRTVSDAGGDPPATDDASPVLILGDSHTLVFHDGGDMFARGAGFADQLAHVLQRPVDLIGVRGSGATPARVNLFRKAQRLPGYWDAKRVVVWCFAAREFTESDGWRVLPIER